MKHFLFFSLTAFLSISANAQLAIDTVKNPNLMNSAKYWDVQGSVRVLKDAVVLYSTNSYIQQLSALSPNSAFRISVDASAETIIPGKSKCPDLTFAIGSWEPTANQFKVFHIQTGNPTYQKSGPITVTRCTSPAATYHVNISNFSDLPSLRQIYVQKYMGLPEIKVNSIHLTPAERTAD